MRPRILAGLLSLLLLAGCHAENQELSPDPENPPAEETGAQAAETVTVHWDALAERKPRASTAKRLKEGPLEDFTPGSYGEIIPYIGGEQKIRQNYREPGTKEQYTTEYLYGLCTTDGTILTDPVYNSVSRLEWYNESSGRSSILPVWMVSQVRRNEAQEEYNGYYTARGLLAADGSWYTGLRYQDGLMVSSDSRVLISEGQEAAVLLSLEDGTALRRYSPYDFLPQEHQDSAQWLFTDGAMGSFTGLEGGCFRFTDPTWTEDEEERLTLWIDGDDGKIVDYLPYVPSYYEDWTGRNAFPGGWYYYDDLYDDDGEGGSVTLHYDDGTEEVLQLDKKYGSLQELNAQCLVFSLWDETTETTTYTVTDHQMNVLYQTLDVGPWFDSDVVTGEQYLACTRLIDPERSAYEYFVMNEQGEEIIASRSYPCRTNGYLAVVGVDAYRLLDLNGGVREVFRIPRWDALDIPAS